MRVKKSVGFYIDLDLLKHIDRLCIYYGKNRSKIVNMLLKKAVHEAYQSLGFEDMFIEV